MRLLTFLSDIERALIAESPVVDGGAWETQRMVNFHFGLARLTLAARPGAEDLPVTGGSILVQSFELADGSLCLKASLNWKDSEASPVISVYSTPNSNWKLEASRIASGWLEGPPAVAATSAMPAQDLRPLTAIAS